jgi:hypothetical protein
LKKKFEKRLLREKRQKIKSKIIKNKVKNKKSKYSVLPSFVLFDRLDPRELCNGGGVHLSYSFLSMAWLR